jgi:hypothetical protein
MRHIRFAPALAALLAAATLGGCVAYTGYPPRYYSYNDPRYGYPAYNYPSGYYAGYPGNYTYSYAERPFYSPDYNSAFGGYTRSGGNGN